MDALKNLMRENRQKSGLKSDEIFNGMTLREWEENAFKVPCCDLLKVFRLYRTPDEDIAEWWLDFQLRKPSQRTFL